MLLHVSCYCNREILTREISERGCVLQELVLRYESLSLAVAAVASQSATMPVAMSTHIGAEQPGTAGMLVPQTAFVQLPTGLSDDHPAAQMQAAADAHIPGGTALETATTPATALALDEASVTAEDAAEKVLKPSTSDGLYDGARLQLPDRIASNPPSAGPASTAGEASPSEAASANADEAGPHAGGNTEVDFVQAMALQDDDRYLSLATGEAQADALNVGILEAGATAAAFSPDAVLPTVQEVNDPMNGHEAGEDAVQPHHPASPGEDLPDMGNILSVSAEEKMDSEGQAGEMPAPRAEQQGATEGTAEHANAGGEPTMEGFEHRPAGLQSRVSISSTAATVGDWASQDIGRLGASPAGSPPKAKSDAGASPTAAIEATESPSRAPSAPGLQGGDQPKNSGAFDDGMPATSSDGDPFYATDLALKVSTAQEEV